VTSDKHFDAEQLIALKRVAQIALSPAGDWIAASVQRLDSERSKYIATSGAFRSTAGRRSSSRAASMAIRRRASVPTARWDSCRAGRRPKRSPTTIRRSESRYGCCRPRAAKRSSSPTSRWASRNSVSPVTAID